VQEIKRTPATPLPLRLPFRRNAFFTQPGFEPFGRVRLSLDKLVSHRNGNFSLHCLGLRPALNSRARRLAAVGDADNLGSDNGQQLNHDVAGAAHRRVQTLRFLYIRLPPWDRLAL